MPKDVIRHPVLVANGFGVRALLCDGASSNLSLLKLFCGTHDDSGSISPWFNSPFEGKRVFLIICPSHQVHIHFVILIPSREYIESHSCSNIIYHLGRY